MPLIEIWCALIIAAPAPAEYKSQLSYILYIQWAYSLRITTLLRTKYLHWSLSIVGRKSLYMFAAYFATPDASATISALKSRQSARRWYDRIINYQMMAKMKHTGYLGHIWHTLIWYHIGYSLPYHASQSAYKYYRSSLLLKQFDGSPKCLWMQSSYMCQ